jgi:glutathione S-transferase
MIEPCTLHHVWLSPFCRKVILVLGEKRREMRLVLEKVWERRPEFFALNPAGQVPVLVEPDGLVVADSAAICEYLDETYPEPPLLGKTAAARAEARRLAAWFDGKFNAEVTQHLLDEKVFKRLILKRTPNSAALRAGASNLHYHLEYIGWLAERRNWLAGDSLSLADLAAAGHLSALDYLGDVPWEDHLPAKEWYMRIKSRPAFRPLLSERMPSLTPVRHYAELDF